MEAELAAKELQVSARWPLCDAALLDQSVHARMHAPPPRPLHPPACHPGRINTAPPPAPRRPSNRVQVHQLQSRRDQLCEQASKLQAAVDESEMALARLNMAAESPSDASPASPTTSARERTRTQTRTPRVLGRVRACAHLCVCVRVRARDVFRLQLRAAPAPSTRSAARSFWAS